MSGIRTHSRVIIAGVLSAALLAGGFWARDKMMASEIGSIFAVGWLSPVLAHYTSAERYDPDTQEQIRQEMESLKAQLETEASWWRVVMIALFVGAGISVVGCGWMVLRTRKMQVGHE